MAEHADDSPSSGGASTWQLPRDPGARRPAPLFQAGEVLAERYRLRRFIARGAMGEVYEAEDREIGIAVALKTLRTEVASSAEALRLFKQEVLFARLVTHPNVCRIFDLSRHRDGSRDVTFLTMELLSGETLAARIRARGPLAPAQALPLVRQMTEGLEAAHRAGVVHRDFKSGNVIVVPGPGGERAVVTDFGLACAAEPEGASAGIAGGMVGTPAYVSPEQLRGERVGPAADLYALGVVLFELVTGKLPFLAADPVRTAALRLTDEPPSPRTIIAELDPSWERAILRLLRRDPRERPARAAEVVRELEGSDRAGRDAIRHRLPAERDAFVGREEELGELARRIAAGARLVSILGPGGTGKTRLACRFGWSALERFAGGVWFCDLSDARSADGVLNAVASALDVTLESRDGAARLGHAIAGRGQALFIFDNFEQVTAHAAATLGPWLERAREAVFLVTSRERLQVAGEEVFPLEPLPVDREGVDLFAHRARAQRPDFAVTAANRDAVAGVVRLVDGLPLAIELAAARARVLPPQQILARLADRFGLLVGKPGSSERQATLRAAIDWSWELLQPWEQAAFAQTSVFEGGFTLAAAEAVIDVSPWPRAPAVLDLVQALVDKSLLRTMASGRDLDREVEEPRFGMYLSLQEYARAKLAAAGAIAEGASGHEAEREAFARHGRHYARHGSDAEIEALDLGDGARLRRQLERELDNLVVACRRAVERGDAQTAVSTYRAAWEVLELRGPALAGVELGKQVASCPGLSPAQLGVVQWTAGHAARLSGRLDEALAAYQEALGLFRRHACRGEEACVLGIIGVVHAMQWRLDEARSHFEGALAIHREVGNRRFEAGFLGNLATLDVMEDRLDEARGHFQAALAIQRELGNRRGEGVVLSNFARLELSQGRIDQAEAHLEAALAAHREVGNRRFEGLVLGLLGDAHRERGQLDRARACLEAALVLHREVGSLGLEGLALGRLADIYLELGSELDARQAITRGEELLRDEAYAQERALVLCARARLEQRAGDASRAGATLVEAEACAGSAVSLPTYIRAALARVREELAAAGSGRSES